MQWSEILAEIKRSLKEPETGGHWTDSELLRRANLIQADICRKTELLLKTNTVSFNAIAENYSIPADCLKVVAVVYENKRLMGTTAQQLDDMCIFNSKVWREETGEPKAYYQEFNVINLVPKPQAASDITLHYIGVADNMVGSTDKPFNNTEQLQSASQAIIDGVIYRCMLEDGNVALSDRYNSLYLQDLKDIKDLKFKIDAVTEFTIARLRG